MRNFLLNTFVFIFVMVFVACGSSSGTSTTNDSGALGNTGAAVGAIFASGGNSSLSTEVSLPVQLIDLFVKQALAQGSENTCDNVSGGPTNVTSSAQGTSGTYGSSSDSQTVDADTDFCQDSSGNSNTNTNHELFASFSVSSASVTCDDGVTMTMSGSGIWRNRPDLGYYPQIYGTFTITENGTESEANCSIALDSDENVASASCTDSDGTAVTIDSTVSCSIDAG